MKATRAKGEGHLSRGRHMSREEHLKARRAGGAEMFRKWVIFRAFNTKKMSFIIIVRVIYRMFERHLGL
jgi:hypothetical protein